MLLTAAKAVSADTERRANSNAPAAILLVEIGAFLAGITLWLNLSEITNFWRFPFTQSFDGMSHLVIGEYYAKHIFPKTWGWAPQWFAGMPFPDFYPPLYYLAIAFLYRILPFSYSAIAKALICGLTLILPGLTASVTRSQTRSWWAAGGAGCLTAILLSYKPYPYGIAVDATLRNGLFTQLPGYVCLLFWQNHFLNARVSPRAARWARVFLFLLLLSSAFIVPIALLFVATTCLAEIAPIMLGRNRYTVFRSLRFYAGLVLGPFAAGAFWYVPLLWHSEYLVTMTLPSMSFHEVAMAGMVPFALTCFALVASILRRDRNVQIVALVCILIALASAADFVRLSPSLPVQPFRLFASFGFLSCIPAGYLVGCFAGRISRIPLRCLALVIFLAPFAQDLAKDKTRAHLLSSYVQNSRSDSRFDLKLPKDHDIINLEIPSSLEDARYLALNGVLAGAGYDTTYAALRESSISSIFMTPLRNGLSNTVEAWGIETFLGFDRDFLSQDLGTQLTRADFMGVGQFVASSPQLAKALDESPRVIFENNLAGWRLYKLANPSMRAQVLRKEPALFFGPVTFKKRSTWSYDYVRLQEEIFFRGKFDTLVARARDMLLDTSPDLDRFHIAIITEYRYYNVDSAYARLKQYAKGNTLICIADNSPLFQRLASTAGESSHIYIFDRLRGDREDVHPLREQLQRLLSLLSRQSPPIAAPGQQSVQSVQIGRQTIKVMLRNPASKRVPVLIKSSYFPYWRRSDAPEPVYMVTPTYMLTYARSGLTLQLHADASVWAGFAISLAAALLAGATRIRSLLTRKLRSSGR